MKLRSEARKSKASSTTKAFKAGGKCSLFILTTWKIKVYLAPFKNIFLSLFNKSWSCATVREQAETQIQEESISCLCP